MDYERIYNDLILHRQKNPIISGYIERHHILPRSLGGSDDITNLVALTGHEHYIAHLLLARFNRCSQTAYAIWMMQMKNGKDSNRPCIKSGRMYEWARKEFAKYISRNNTVAQKGERNSQFGLMWITNRVLNKKISKDADIPKGWSKGRNLSNKIAQKGEQNSQFGTQWISNIELKESTCIDKTLPIPEGWVKGRNRWNTIIETICIKCDCKFLAKTKRVKHCSRKCCVKPLTEENKTTIVSSE